MPPLRTLLLLPLLVIAAAPSAAQSDQRRYVVDDSQSDVVARVAFLGLAHKTARFPDMQGTLRFSLGDYQAIDMAVDVDARTLTTGDSETARLRGRQFFDVEHHPTVRFVGRRMELTGERTASVSGQITARGVTRPATIVVTFSQAPFQTSGTEPLSIVGTTTIDRRQFGMTAFPLIIGNRVAVTIRARMVPG